MGIGQYKQREEREPKKMLKKHIQMQRYTQQSNKNIHTHTKPKAIIYIYIGPVRLKKMF